MSDSRYGFMASDDVVSQNLRGHLRILGVCWVVYGVICLIAAACMLAYSGTATVMFGALLARVPDPFALMSFFHLIYTGVVVLSAICGLLGILAGVALLARRRSGRTLALLAGFLSLSRIPLGITLGVYTLIILLPLTASHPAAGE